MKTFFRYLRFWECWCFDAVHHGDNPGCPAHGIWPGTVRALIIITIFLIFVAIVNR